MPTQPRTSTRKKLMPLYAESINMLEGLAEEDMDRYLNEHSKIVPLFEVDVVGPVALYIVHPEEVWDKPVQEAIREFQQAQEALEREMALLQ